MQVSFCANSLDHVTLKDLKIRGRERLRVRDLSLGFLTYSQKIDYPENFIVLFFPPEKLALSVIFIEGGYALSRSQNDKTSKIW